MSADEKLRLANEEFLDAEREYFSATEHRYNDGKAEGKTETTAKILCSLIRAKFKNLPTEVEQQILQFRVANKLEKAAEEIFSAQSLAEVLSFLK